MSIKPPPIWQNGDVDEGDANWMSDFDKLLPQVFKSPISIFR